MRSFVFKILIVAIPCLAFLGWIEWKLRSIPNDYTYKKEYLDTRSNEIEHLILGSSLSWRGIDPEFVGPNTYNASFSGQSLKYDAYLLSLYQDKLTSLKDVVITIYYPTFEFERNELLGNIDKFYSVYFDYGPPTVLFNLYNGTQITNQLRRYGEDPRAFIKSDSMGFRGEVAPLVGTIEENAKKMAYFHTADFPDVRKVNLEHLNKIISICKKSDANLYLVIHPANDYYRNGLDDLQTKRMRDICSSVEDENVHVLDLFESSEFSVEDFFDGIHLNENGAKKLSQLISKELNK